MTYAAFTLLLVGAIVSQVYSNPPVRDVLIVVFDGLNDDYFTNGYLPKLVKGGEIGKIAARPELMHSENPTKSFSTLHTVATGVLPNVHGVILNEMFDKNGNRMKHTEEQYSYIEKILPLWAQAEKAGIKTAVDMWPGSGFQYDKTKFPTKIVEYKAGEKWAPRIKEIVKSLKNDDITFAMAYFEDNQSEDNTTPVTEEPIDYCKRVEEAISLFLEELDDHDIDIIIMSDHGTKEVKIDHVLNINTYFPNSANYDIIVAGPISIIRCKTDAAYENFFEEYDLKFIDLNNDDKNDIGTLFKIYPYDDEELAIWNLDLDSELLNNSLIVTTLNGYTFYEEVHYKSLIASGETAIRENGYLNSDPDMDGMLYLIGPSFKNDVVLENAEMELHEVYEITQRLLGIANDVNDLQKKTELSDNMKKLCEHNALSSWGENCDSHEDDDSGSGSEG